MIAEKILGILCDKRSSFSQDLSEDEFIELAKKLLPTKLEKMGVHGITYYLSVDKPTDPSYNKSKHKPYQKTFNTILKLIYQKL